ncbi:hypothetical protein [Candidatus Clostridium stratigraminis]|uniref:Sporulation inhibitor A n=1 Tax=Candidatus Clostridium stratigraminis TaxID=3381661 RepID=A0ABW8SZC7_9CLOT
MNILMYVISKEYRDKLKQDFNKDLSNKLEQEVIQNEFIYKKVLEGNLN